jgi:hypothetical protein
LDEGSNLLDKYVDFPGKRNLEESCLLVLRILDRGLELQPKMLEVARTSGTRRILNPVDKLLLGLNPRSYPPHVTTKTPVFSIFTVNRIDVLIRINYFNNNNIIIIYYPYQGNVPGLIPT